MSRKKSLRHIDFERYQEQNAFKKRLRACIVAIAKWKTTLPHYEDSLYKLLRMLKAPVIENVYALSDHGHDFRTINIRPELQLRLRDKYNCLCATLAFIFLQWWNYQHMLVSSNRMNHIINYLENIVDKGVDAFNIVGNVRKGWRLHG